MNQTRGVKQMELRSSVGMGVEKGRRPFPEACRRASPLHPNQPNYPSRAQVRGEGGYDDGSEDVPRLRVLDLHVQMRRCPKPIIAMVAGYAMGGGHILHMVADLTIAADNAVFGQTGPRVGRCARSGRCTVVCLHFR